MKVHAYERVFMGAAVALIAGFVAAIGVSTFAYGVRPPSHVETIDPTKVMQDARFGSPGVAVQADGSVRVTMVLLMFAFLPSEIRVPAGQPVTFRVTSMDVTHGFQISGTNANAMVIPGYVSQFTYTFREPGEHLVICNEYCGLGHHTMQAKLIVEPAGAPVPEPPASAATPTGASP